MKESIASLVGDNISILLTSMCNLVVMLQGVKLHLIQAPM